MCSAVAQRCSERPRKAKRRSGEVPGFIGCVILKPGFRCVFKNEHELFPLITGKGMQQLNALQAKGGKVY